MRLFDQREIGRIAIQQAREYAEAGGQGLHVWDPGPQGWRGAPAVFQRHRPWAHLIDYDLDRLVRTAKRLGVRVIKVGHEGKRFQHIDLCGKPLQQAMLECEKAD